MNVYNMKMGDSDTDTYWVKQEGAKKFGDKWKKIQSKSNDHIHKLVKFKKENLAYIQYWEKITHNCIKLTEKAYSEFTSNFSQLISGYYKERVFIDYCSYEKNLFLQENRFCFWMRKYLSAVRSQIKEIVKDVVTFEKLCNEVKKYSKTIVDFFDSLYNYRCQRKVDLQKWYGKNVEIYNFNYKIAKFHNKALDFNLFNMLPQKYKDYLKKKLEIENQDMIKNNEFITFFHYEGNSYSPIKLRHQVHRRVRLYVANVGLSMRRVEQKP